jgi:hypothetical protein
MTRRLRYSQAMKKNMVVVLIIFSLLLPTPAQAFLNRDCSNLKKRVSTNQVKYEQAWDKYQSALGKYWAISNPRPGAGSEVANRLNVTYSVSELMLLDMKKYPKCLRVATIIVNRHLTSVQKNKSDTDWIESFGPDLFAPSLPEIFDFRTYLK